jgi:hypothetical protein
VHDDITDPRGHPAAPQGIRCRACGRIEPDPGARFCGVCGATLHQAGATGPQPDTVQLAPSGEATIGRYEPAVSSSYGQPPAPTGAIGRGGQTVYRVPSLGLGGAARIGAAVSAAFALLPCLLIGFAAAWGVHALRLLLDSWLAASVPVPVPLVRVDLTMNFVELLHLRQIYDQLISWDNRLWLTFAIGWLVPWAISIVAGALFGLLLALIYNLVGSLGGGLRLTLSPDEVAPPETWSAPMSPGPPPTWAADRQR